ncbi:aspartyl-phosphate phosphatase Spo0E family protein [Bacillus testis]|uniref:aspartyl-phosphate phosphatase Spo0E family protein n=1 Tax=Bacillus testis TaxID=1622072 RepID=UPI0009466010|nr:aspartyl-phosphate phosphatase Spo0E family protein [Bacillus testis]
MSKNELLQLIETKRKELVNIASKYGLTASATLQHSQELDCLLNQYEQFFLSKSI